jgi:hypothetical protein
MSYMSVSDLLLSNDEEFRIEDGDCPRCNFNRALHQHNAFGCENVTVFCFRCGYYDYSALKLDTKGRIHGSEHQTSQPVGLLVVGGNYDELNSEEETQEKAAWLRAEIAAGKIAGRDAYVSRWDEATQQAELVEGSYPW